MLGVLTSDEFNWEHIPTIFQNQQHEMKVNGTDYNLDLWDTAGKDGFVKQNTQSCGFGMVSTFFFLWEKSGLFFGMPF